MELVGKVIIVGSSINIVPALPLASNTIIFIFSIFVGNISRLKLLNFPFKTAFFCQRRQMVNMQISYLKASFPFGWNEKLFDFVWGKVQNMSNISAPRSIDTSWAAKEVWGDRFHPEYNSTNCVER